MYNTIKTLIHSDEISLTMIDGTKMAQKAIELHQTNQTASSLLVKCLLFTAYMSVWLKGEKGSVSLAVKGDGAVKNISASGNYFLDIRGSIDEPRPKKAKTNACFLDDASTIFQKEGTVTVIRDDGYSRPFVGSVEAVFGNFDRQMEEYFSVSEQLPTHFSTRVEFASDGSLSFAGLVCLQPLPFASKEGVALAQDKKLQEEALKKMKESVLLSAKERYFAESVEEKEVRYQCNCSRNYIGGVLVSMGKESLLQIVKEEGKVSVHCHYCNTDYTFLKEDIEDLFSEK